VRINQNIAAFNAYRNLSTTDAQLSKSLEKLSSGFRINRAADDAAGLAKSESLRAEIRGNRQAIRNAQDGVSFVQTAEGALNEVHSILQRMRELAVDAANTATTDGTAQQAEIAELLTEIDNIGSNTTFAGQTVFQDYSGAGNELTFHVGANSGDTLQIASDLTLSQADVFGTDISTVDVSVDADTAITTLRTQASTFGSNLSVVEARQDFTKELINVLETGAAGLTLADTNEEGANLLSLQTRQQLSTVSLSLATQADQNVLRLF